MPTLNPRINVTLSPSLDSLVADLAQLQRVSKSSVLREFLEAVEPQLRQAVALMKAAQSAKPDALKAVARDFNTILKAAESAQDLAMLAASGATRDLVAEAQAVKGRRPGRLGAERTPARDGGAKAPSHPAGGTSRRKDPPISNRGVKS